MKKIFFTIVFFLCALTYAFAQVPGNWESHVICKECSLNYILEGYPGKLDFADEIHGMIIGDDSHYLDANSNDVYSSRDYVTTDGGKTWVLEIDSTLSALSGNTFFKYLTPDFASSFSSHGIAYSSDQGKNWNNVNGRDPSYQFQYGKGYSSSLYYEISHSSDYIHLYLTRTNDTGNTYTIINDINATGNIIVFSPYMYDTTNIWSLVSEHQSTNSVLHTMDGGMHWIRSFPYDTSNGKNMGGPNGIIGNNNPNDLYLVNGAIKDNQYNIVSQFDLLFTTDGGKTWQADSSNHGRLASVVGVGNSTLWGLIGTDNRTYRLHCDTLAYSPNNGKNWYYDANVIKGDSIVYMTWKDSTHGYMIGYSGTTLTFYKYIPPPASVDFTKIVYSEASFSVKPTITSGVIHLHPNMTFSGTMEVYDILGRLWMQTSLSSKLGEEKEFSLSALPSGMYFLTFTSGSNYSAVRVIKE